MIRQKRVAKTSRLQRSLKRKSTRQRLVRYGLVVANVVVLAIVAYVVVTASHNSATAITPAVNSSRAVTAVQPVDGMTAFDIAANVARMADLPESTAVNNEAQSAQAEVALNASNTPVVAKPQIVLTALKSKDDIQSYVVQPGDTIASIAQKFNITSNSLSWSNNLSGVAVAAGTKLEIPPMNGIVYTVKAGDTIQSLATKFSANAAEITAYNNAEINGIQVGEMILIPNGQVQAVVTTTSYGDGAFNLASGGSYTAIYGNNGYDFGTCTWYVASQISVPSNWGNANTWAYYAALSGWTVSSTPTVGAIAQTSGMSAWGHVAIVTAVNGNQITISDMNDPYWDRVTTHTMPASEFQHYITH